MNPAAYFKVALDTISLGDSLDIQIALENVTDVPMDSMRTKYTIQMRQWNNTRLYPKTRFAFRFRYYDFAFPSADIEWCLHRLEQNGD